MRTTQIQSIHFAHVIVFVGGSGKQQGTILIKYSV